MHCYTSTGSHTVTLMAEVVTETDTLTRTGCITVTSGGCVTPTAGFSASPPDRRPPPDGDQRRHQLGSTSIAAGSGGNVVAGPRYAIPAADFSAHENLTNGLGCDILAPS